MRDAPHTLRVFDDDLDQLRAGVSEMGGRAEAAIGDAIAALLQGDEERARGVVEGDARIDALAVEIERDAIRTIALRNPLADDLREVLAALKIAGSIARMGDCARNIAHRVPVLRGCRRMDQLRIVPALQEKVAAMVAAALDGFVRRSAEAALGVLAADEEVDELYACMFRELVGHMTAAPQDIGAGTHLLFVAQKLERIGDHACAIAEIVHFAVTGNQPAPRPEPDGGLAPRIAW